MIYIADYERYIFILLGASKFAYTSFLFAATTAQTTMNKAIQDMSASVQVKVGTNSLWEKTSLRIKAEDKEMPATYNLLFK